MAGVPAKADYFYPRSPCGERPPKYLTESVSQYFYPRSPCGERLQGPGFVRYRVNFYPRSPCGERLTLIWDVIAVITISIHALLAESDTCFQLWSPPLQHFYPRSPCGERLCGCELKVRSCRFLSTLSLRRATKDTTARQQIADISIHALLAESDQNISGYRRGYGNFYPRSPCGERHYFCGPAL